MHPGMKPPGPTGYAPGFVPHVLISQYTYSWQYTVLELMFSHTLSFATSAEQEKTFGR